MGEGGCAAAQGPPSPGAGGGGGGGQSPSRPLPGHPVLPALRLGARGSSGGPGPSGQCPPPVCLDAQAWAPGSWGQTWGHRASSTVRGLQTQLGCEAFSGEVAAHPKGSSDEAEGVVKGSVVVRAPRRPLVCDVGWRLQSPAPLSLCPSEDAIGGRAGSGQRGGDMAATPQAHPPRGRERAEVGVGATGEERGPASWRLRPASPGPAAPHSCLPAGTRPSRPDGLKATARGHGTVWVRSLPGRGAGGGAVRTMGPRLQALGAGVLPHEGHEAGPPRRQAPFLCAPSSTESAGWSSGRVSLD